MALNELMSFAPTMAQPAGLADILQQQATQPLMQQFPPVEAPKPGAFQKGGRGWEILGLIGDALQTTGGGQATYAPMVAHERELETEGRQRLAELIARQQQRQQEREQALADRKALIDYGNANPAPDSFQKAIMGAKIDPNSERYRQLYEKRAEMLTNPVQLVSDGMGGTVAVRPNEAGGLQPGHTEDGYTFMGGDPGDPSNWKQGGGVGGDTGMFP